MASEFKIVRRVEFGDTDMAGIVHHAVFFRYMEAAETAFFRSLGLSLASRQAKPPVGWPRVHCECDFFAPLQFEDEVEIHLLVAKKKAKTLTYAFRLHQLKGKERREVARGLVVTVCVTALGGKMKATKIPRLIADKIQWRPHGCGLEASERRRAESRWAPAKALRQTICGKARSSLACGPMNWLVFALLTVVSWGVYGLFLHSGQMGMQDKVNGRYMAFLYVGFAYFLIAVLAPLAVLAFNKGRLDFWNYPANGLWWSLIAGVVGAVGAFGVLLAFGAKGTPSVVMAIVFAGAPIVNALVSLIQHPPEGGLGSIKPQFFVGIALAALGGCLVTYYKPAPAPPPPVSAGTTTGRPQ